MSVAAFPAFIGGSYTPDSRTADAERTVNFYVEPMEVPGAATQAALMPTPGVTPYATSLAVGWRATFTDDASGRAFGVVGGSFVEVTDNGNQTGTVTVRGAVATDANPATISTNGDAGGQLLITSGGNAYCFDLSTNTLTLEVAGEATVGAVLYGYGLIFNKATGKVRLSDLDDLTAWDPTQFFQRSINADPWQSLWVTPNGYIILPGTQTGESWYNAGTFPIPFQPDPSGQFAVGCAATFSMQQLGDTVVWLAKDASGSVQVVRQSGFTPQRISTYPVEDALSTYNADLGVADAIGQVYGEVGHLFYLLTFPSANATWCFDASVVGRANPWHERSTWIAEEARDIAWRPVFHMFAFGLHLMGDVASATLYRMAHDLTLDVENRPMRRVRRSPPLIQLHQRFTLRALELHFQTGVGTATGQGQVPMVTVRVSRDGGFTWGAERALALGRMGEYWVRVRAEMLGQARSFNFEVVCTDPVACRLVNAYVDARPSTEQAA